MAVEKKNETTADEKRLAWNDYIRDYNRRRREEKKLILQQVIERKYEKEVFGGTEHE